NLNQGQITNGLFFDGVDDRIVLADINSDSWTQLTLEAWISHADISDTGSIITKEDDTGGGYTWALRIASERVRSRLITDPDDEYLSVYTADVISVVDEWYQVIFTWDGEDSKYYANDIYLGRIGHSGSSIANSLDNVSIGATVAGNTDRFHGIIDEVRVSSVTRSQDWIFTQTNNQRNPESFYTLDTLEKYELTEDWPFSSLPYSKNVTIFPTNFTQDLTDFPILINIFDRDLKEKAQTEGTDILFTDLSGNRLEHEIDRYRYNHNSTHIQMEVWVSLPIVHSSETTIITLYYGNSTVIRHDSSNDVWNEYSGVWHLTETVADEETTLQAHLNSVNNEYDGTHDGNTDIIGQIGKAQIFDGDDSIVITESINPGSNVTISGWFYLHDGFNSSSNNSMLLLDKYLSSQDNLHIGLIGNDYNRVLGGSKRNGSMVFKVENGGTFEYIWTTKNNWNASTVYHFSIIHYENDPTLNKIYINGVDETFSLQEGCTSCTISIDFPGEWSFGGGTTDSQFPNDSGWLDGRLDEIRISNKIFSEGMILGEYLNQLDPIQYYSVGEEFLGDFQGPQIISFGVYDPGKGSVDYWANITDLLAEVNSTQIKITDVTNNITNYFDLTFNGTYWIYRDFPIFTHNYTYQIVNGTDSKGNYLENPSLIESKVYNYDIEDPEILEVEYIANLGYLGTFRANVTDSWGSIDKVFVEVLSCFGCGSPPIRVEMKKNRTFEGNINEYINDTIFMTKGQVEFVIMANDSSNNVDNSILYQSSVNNKAPQITDITFSQPTSNQSLNVDYTFFDPDGDNEEEAQTQIRWYQEGILQPLYNDLKIIPAYELIKGEEWNITILPHDGFIFGNMNQSLVLIENSAPIASNLVPDTNLTTNINLVADWDYYDIDGDNESPIFILKWYKEEVPHPLFDNIKIIPSVNTSRGEYWHYTLQVYDGIEYSDIFTSDDIYIINSAPVITLAEI
ncbi:MAG: DUF2341 domain-containing protein, partial [Candidatus Kariarchaeaceae archaeon]